jgi:hypothetical protein
MDFVQALVQELGAIESKAKVLSNPGSCPTCNDCEGWEGKTTKSRGNTLVLNKWPTAPFRLETSVKNLESSADSGCTTCGVFRDVIAHFRPTLECNLEVEAWLPMRGLLPQLKIKMEYSVEDGPNGIRNQFELFTAPGIIPNSQKYFCRCFSLVHGCRFPPQPSINVSATLHLV